MEALAGVVIGLAVTILGALVWAVLARRRPAPPLPPEDSRRAVAERERARKLELMRDMRRDGLDDVSSVTDPDDRSDALAERLTRWRE